MHYHCLQHVAYENPGTILEWIDNNHHTISYTYLFENNHSFPAQGAFEALIVLGGYMNVDEEEKYPWLKVEKEFIRQTLEADKKVLGICLGSQLLANAFGCSIVKGPEKEIGFFPVEFSPEATLHPIFSHLQKPINIFHWHSYTFNIPDNAIRVASTVAYNNQGFMIGEKILALQFHLEMDETIINRLIESEAIELNEKGQNIQNKEAIKKSFHTLPQNKIDFFKILNKFFSNEL